jgi:hypothetical protein
MTDSRDKQPRIEALIEASLAGELSGQDRAELNRHVLEDPGVRALHDDLQQVDEWLKALPAAEPPASLRNEILQGMPAIGPGQSKRTLPGGRDRRVQLPRMAAAFVGGAIVTGLLFQMLVSDRHGMDPDQLVGTMAAMPEKVGEPLGTVRLGDGRASGSAVVYRSGPALWVELDIESDAPWELEASYDPAVADLRSVSRPEGQMVPFEVSAGRVRFSGDEGQGTYHLYMTSSDQASVRIALALTVSGQRVAEGALSAPATPGGPT